VTDAMFSDRSKDPAFVANLRKAKFLIVHSWDATHPLCDVADVLIPGAIDPEKDGTFTNLQGRVQRIHQAFPPKGQAVSDLEALRRIGARLYPDAAEFAAGDAFDVFEDVRAAIPQLAEVSA
jgi:formate dehydrogenase major subunit